MWLWPPLPCLITLSNLSQKGLGSSTGRALASLIVQLVKNLPAMQKAPVQLMGQEDLLEKR